MCFHLISLCDTELFLPKWILAHQISFAQNFKKISHITEYKRLKNQGSNVYRQFSWNQGMAGVALQNCYCIFFSNAVFKTTLTSILWNLKWNVMYITVSSLKYMAAKICTSLKTTALDLRQFKRWIWQCKFKIT